MACKTVKQEKTKRKVTTRLSVLTVESLKTIAVEQLGKRLDTVVQLLLHYWNTGHLDQKKTNFIGLDLSHDRNFANRHTQDPLCSQFALGFAFSRVTP